MSKAIDLTGRKFGKLTAKHQIIVNEKVKWFCQCDCTNTTEVLAGDLLSGNTQSCGCLQKEKASIANKRYNEYDLSGEYGIGYTRKGEEFYFDLEDYELIKDHCWWIETRGRVCARSQEGKTPFKLHRMVMNVNDPKIEVDHINHNQSDNRKSNLRICTRKQNSRNTRVQKSNTSGYKGVWLRKDTGKYTARIEVDGKRINLGNYDDMEDALIARLKAEKEYFGEYSSQQELFKKYNI